MRLRGDSKARYRQRRLTKAHIALSIWFLGTLPVPVIGDDVSPMQLAKIFTEDTDVTEFLVSEKLDGIRAIWKDGVLRTRTGEPISAPKWFVAPLPDVWLDGELWTKRQDFENIASIVRKVRPVDAEWRQVTYMVFDAPDTAKTFQERAEVYSLLLKRLALDHVRPIRQFRVADNTALKQLLAQYTAAGAEGLMLHKADAMHQDGRTDNLLKLKPYLDDEATVIGYSPGKGKHTGKMGALKVKWIAPDGAVIVFRIGTGFSDADRANPPGLGSTITFEYHGITKRGIPRFASCLKGCGRH